MMDTSFESQLIDQCQSHILSVNEEDTSYSSSEEDQEKTLSFHDEPIWKVKNAFKRGQCKPANTMRECTPKKAMFCNQLHHSSEHFIDIGNNSPNSSGVR